MIQVTIHPGIPSTVERLQRVLESLSAYDAPMTVTFENFGADRTQAQNRRYRAMLTKYCEHTGEDPGEVHERNLRLLVPPNVWENASGQIRVTATRSSDLSKRMFGALMDRFSAHAASEHGLTL